MFFAHSGPLNTTLKIASVSGVGPLPRRPDVRQCLREGSSAPRRPLMTSAPLCLSRGGGCCKLPVLLMLTLIAPELHRIFVLLTPSCFLVTRCVGSSQWPTRYLLILGSCLSETYFLPCNLLMFSGFSLSYTFEYSPKALEN